MEDRVQLFRSTVVGAFLFLASLAINFYASYFAAEKASLAVTDIVLNNFRVYDVDGIILFMAGFLLLLVLLAVVRRPRLLPFVLKSAALFYLVRSAFVSLTHIGPFEPRLILDPGRVFTLLGLGYAGDLFFSGHTGMPFLLALLFWNKKILRWIFLASSVILALAMLLGHLHYSIDVFAAFFITYSIYHLARFFFFRDYTMFQSALTK